MEQLTPQILGIIGLSVLVALIGGTVWVAGPEIRAGLAWLLHRYVNVKAFAAAPADYDNRDDDERDDEGAFLRDGKAETAKTSETETAPKSPALLPSFDVKALQEDGKVYALGAALAHGVIPAGNRTAAIRAVFGPVTGERYSRLARQVRHYEAQVLATLPPVEDAQDEEAAARIIPINDGKKGYVELT